MLFSLTHNTLSIHKPVHWAGSAWGSEWSVILKSVPKTIAHKFTSKCTFLFILHVKWCTQYSYILKGVEVRGTKGLLMLYKSHWCCNGQLLQLHLELIKIQKACVLWDQNVGRCTLTSFKGKRRNASKQKGYKSAFTHIFPMVQWELNLRSTWIAYSKIGLN